jgi:hypothetical protein
MAELSLDGEQRHALARHLHRVGVSQLMGGRTGAVHPRGRLRGAAATGHQRAPTDDHVSGLAGRKTARRPPAWRAASAMGQLLPGPPVHADFPSLTTRLCRGGPRSRLGSGQGRSRSARAAQRPDVISPAGKTRAFRISAVDGFGVGVDECARSNPLAGDRPAGLCSEEPGRKVAL